MRICWNPPKNPDIEALRERLVGVEERLLAKHGVSDTARLRILINSGEIPETMLLNEWYFLRSAVDFWDADHP